MRYGSNRIPNFGWWTTRRDLLWGRLLFMTVAAGSLGRHLSKVDLTHSNLWRRRMFRPARDGHHRTQCRIFRYRKNHQLASFQSMRAVPMCGLYSGALSSVQKQ